MPPPPPEPPPIPRGGGFLNAGKTINNNPQPDRNALLSQIKKGARLKKTETNDRSAPIVDGKASSGINQATKANSDFRPNGPSHVIPPGGLFAQGIPKLRPTVPRSGDTTGCAVFPSSVRLSTNSSLDHLHVGQVGGSRSQPPSPVSKPRQASGPASHRSSNPNFPEDVTIKGPAPPPPPANQKPNFKGLGNSDDNPQNLDSAAKRFAVRRSASQTNLGQRPRLSRPPPNVKPPPPPKSNCALQNTPPPPPSKPPSILRRQSFGVAESHASRFGAAKLSVVTNSPPKAIPKTIGPPPPPPRNNSAPNDLNQMVNNSSGVYLSKMNTAPPPPPPNRTVALGNRAPMRPPPPRAPAPPPPPQHQLHGHPAPPSQLKAVPPMSSAPPPPTRISSIKPVTSDFEARFSHMFCPAQNLPKPERFMNCEKQYPSKANRLRPRQHLRRQPPPPPPPNSIADANRAQQPIHLQLGASVFPNNMAHC